ncbi:DUF488 domain-containing protein [Gulosibacter molinativorax]|uniref:DUF488 domain-containing protein n=1 Tax=Gulosibacter molinativorax TaxID=256821 RepID=A0ABT7C9V1_9MICO|nr:DUF488 domain-containing protein [Gulosibacter molinativorax]MDJ1371991.1 DUF488 domain-containing protein [Gulosibacter molinativorax]QUY62644.1 Uncharacterized protein yeaO [Gulosibacter molinativorax]
MVDIRVARVYDEPEPESRYRVLVDRLWPRGIKKEALAYDEWDKNVAPSPDLRKWFGHEPERFDEFTNRYRQELDESDAPQQLLEAAGTRDISLLIAAKDHQHNHGIVLRDYLREVAAD